VRPHAGVECAHCRREKDHRCQAQIYVDGDALCLPCADGLPCVVDRVGGPPAPESIEIALLGTALDGPAPAAPVIHRTPEELGIPAVVPADTGRPWMTDEEFAEKKREAFEFANAVRRRERRKPEPNFSVRAYRVRKQQLEEKVIAGERVRMSPGVTMGPEMLAPRRARHFQPEDLERRRRELTARNVAKGAATRAKVAELLGTAPDKAIAAEAGVGVSASRVAQLRKEKGIAPVVTSNSHPGEKRTEEAMDAMREAVKKLGGTMTDAALGEQLGCSGSRVGQLRKEFGIPAARPGGFKQLRQNPIPPGAPAQSKALIKAEQRPVAIPESDTFDALVDAVEVRLQLTPMQARARLAKLTPKQMAVALGAVLQASLRED
jgi:hypothetical protein